MIRNLRRLVPGVLPRTLIAAGLLLPATASGAPITYDDIALTNGAGFSYRRAPSTTQANFDAVKVLPFMDRAALNATPLKWRGAPGVAVFDYDGDGDLDVYVTNGPGHANSLYRNMLAETGTFRFEDVGVQAGVGAVDQDSTGVCYGDIDNDGDQDLMVLGRMEPNRLFRNEGNGVFTEISSQAQVNGTVRGHSSCAMGDINGDGLLDIFVANTFDWARQEAVFTNAFGFNHHNQLLVNAGNNVFADVTSSSGVLKMEGVPPGDGTITWAAALVDYDQDGDLDLFLADDQAALPPSFFAGVNRGYLQIFDNDGTGKFTNVTARAGTARPSSWMGLSFGDLNSDGHMDFFSTSVGDYLIQQMGIPTPPGYSTSRWYLGLGGPDGSFTTPEVSPLGASPFGWGTVMFDYDNDGDTDVAFYGALDAGPFVSCDNPGVILANDGDANFFWDRAATAQTADKVSRSDANGLAVGDLNGDGFVDIVHVSGSYVPPSMPVVPFNQKWGSPFDVAASYAPSFLPIGPMEWEWGGKDTEGGLLGVQISSASNGNNWAKVILTGTKDLTTDGRVNRDGIGAIVRFTPEGGRQVMYPVLGGSSHASQNTLHQTFGLGDKTQGMTEILWPGGIVNRLYDVVAGETVTMPEIPCAFTGPQSGTRAAYSRCVNRAANELFFRGVITAKMAGRIRDSAFRAWDETH
jgi:enediyne biosynthesis protein E4